MRSKKLFVLIILMFILSPCNIKINYIEIETQLNIVNPDENEIESPGKYKTPTKKFLQKFGLPLQFPDEGEIENQENSQDPAKKYIQKYELPLKIKKFTKRHLNR